MVVDEELLVVNDQRIAENVVVQILEHTGWGLATLSVNGKGEQADDEQEGDPQ